MKPIIEPKDEGPDPGAAENARLRGLLQMVKAAAEAMAERERLRTLAEALADRLKHLLMNQPRGHDSERSVEAPKCLCRWCKAHRTLQHAKDQGIGG